MTEQSQKQQESIDQTERLFVEVLGGMNLLQARVFCSETRKELQSLAELQRQAIRQLYHTRDTEPLNSLL